MIVFEKSPNKNRMLQYVPVDLRQFQRFLFYIFQRYSRSP